MEKVEQLIEKAFNDKFIHLDDILEFDLSNDDYNKLIKILQSKSIKIIDDYLIERDGQLELIALKQYVNEVSKIQMLSETEEKELFTEYSRTKDHTIREKLICSNLRLVIKIASEYQWRLRNNSNELLDLIQEGNNGLIKAVEKFDVSLGNRFGVYAPWWIRQSIASWLDNRSGLVRLPKNITTDYLRIQKQKNEIKKNTGREISDFEAAQLLGIRDKSARNIIDKSNLFFSSIDEFVINGGKKIKADYMESSESTMEDDICEKLIFEEITRIMKTVLTPREFFIVSCKNGIINEVNKIPGEKKLEEVGQILGLTRERIRQILNGAYKKIKSAYENEISEKKR